MSRLLAPTAQQVLAERGHSSSGFCQKCWDEAFMRSPGVDQTENYYAVMKEREAEAAEYAALASTPSEAKP